MAAIDKIYGTRDEYVALRQWLHKTGRKKHIERMWDRIPDIDGKYSIAPISNFRCWMDKDLYLNCPLDFVRERILEQYGNNEAHIIEVE